MCCCLCCIFSLLITTTIIMIRDNRRRSKSKRESLPSFNGQKYSCCCFCFQRQSSCRCCSLISAVASFWLAIRHMLVTQCSFDVVSERVGEKMEPDNSLFLALSQNLFPVSLNHTKRDSCLVFEIHQVMRRCLLLLYCFFFFQGYSVMMAGE